MTNTNTTCGNCGHEENIHDIAPTGCVYGVSEEVEPCPCPAYRPVTPAPAVDEATGNESMDELRVEVISWARVLSDWIGAINVRGPQPEILREMKTSHKKFIESLVKLDNWNGDGNAYLYQPKDDLGYGDTPPVPPQPVVERGQFYYRNLAVFDATGATVCVVEWQGSEDETHKIGQQIAEALNAPDKQNAADHCPCTSIGRAVCRTPPTAEGVLRSLAAYVGNGGYNASTVDPETFEKKIREGIDTIIEVEANRRAETQNAASVRELLKKAQNLHWADRNRTVQVSTVDCELCNTLKIALAKLEVEGKA